MPLWVTSLLLASALLQAQSDLYWNPDDGGSGNWNSTDTVWSTNPAGSGDTAWSSSASNTDIAIFDFTGGTVSLQSALGAGGMRFDVDGYTVSASSVTQFQLNEDRTIHVATGAEATLGSNFRLMAPGSSGDIGFDKTGEGTLIVNGPAGGNVYFGGTGGGDTRRIRVSAGTLQINTGSINNTRNHVEVMSGAVMDVVGVNLNVGGLDGSGTVTNTSENSRALFIRGSNLDFSGVLAGNLSILKLNGTGQQTLSGSDANTFTGPVSLNIGRIFLEKDDGVTAISGTRINMNAGGSTINELRWLNNEQVSLTTELAFVGLTSGLNNVNLNGHSERLGNLVLEDPGAYDNGVHLIDYGVNATAQYLWFSEFIVNDSNAPFITIANFEEGVDSLRFDSNPSANLAYLRFDDGVDLLTATAFFDSVNEYWVVAPIPEPAAAAWLVAILSFGLLIWHRRRNRSL